MPTRLWIGLWLALASCHCSRSEPSIRAEPNEADGVPVVTATARGFSPATVRLKKGGSGLVRFIRTENETCATEVELPALGIKQPLPLQKTVELTIPTGVAREYEFTCGMGMFESKVVVE